MLKTLGETEIDKEDKKLINSMINDVTFIIEWLELGKNPDEFRGINKRYAYDISYLSNMDIIPDITEQLEREKPRLTEKQQQQLIRIFDVLSDRERDCLLLHIGQDKSMQEVADELGISKSSVQMYVRRAREKINEVLSYACHTN